MISRIFKKSDFLSLLFGMVMILVIFGDSLPVPNAGNLDTIFGKTWWPAMDVIYPLASIVIFLLYGRSKGRLRITPGILWPVVVFLIAAAVVQLDDFFVVFKHPITLSWSYWTIVRWLYFFVATSMFLIFGYACQKKQEPSGT